MRARTVNEAIGFERGGDAKKAIGIGVNKENTFPVDAIILSTEFKYDARSKLVVKSYNIDTAYTDEESLKKLFIEWGLTYNDIKPYIEEVSPAEDIIHKKLKGLDWYTVPYLRKIGFRWFEILGKIYKL